MNPPVYNKYVNGKGNFWKYIRKKNGLILRTKYLILVILVNLGLEGRRDRVERFSASLSKWFGETD